MVFAETIGDSEFNLSTQQWFIRLRWFAAIATVTAALCDWFFLDWFTSHMEMLLVGSLILAHNIIARLMITPDLQPDNNSEFLVKMAGFQIVVDLLCLSSLVALTGGLGSPLLWFYVFHMVISSLILPHPMAYAAFLFSTTLVCGALWLTNTWPNSREDLVKMLGWFFTMLTTVYLTSHITFYILQQRIRMRAISERLYQQDQAMIRQDKMAAMGQMAAGIAHEISNPLACIDSLIQLVRRKPEHQLKDYTDQLTDLVKRADGILRQLVNFAHPTSLEHRNRVPVKDVVSRALQMVSFDKRFKRVSVNFDVENSDNLYILVHHPSIEQVLVNILQNALDAMDDQTKPELTITIDGKDDKCAISIADNGRGINPDDIDKIFNPFYTTKPIGKGTGLGLAISYKLVEGNDGQLTAQSNARHTTFTITFPLANDSQE